MVCRGVPDHDQYHSKRHRADRYADCPHGGYLAQKTSVPGVAQRTGATVYYVELFPKAAARAQQPVLALMPVAGDVDIVLASEFMPGPEPHGRALRRQTWFC